MHFVEKKKGREKKKEKLKSKLDEKRNTSRKWEKDTKEYWQFPEFIKISKFLIWSTETL